MKDQEDQKERGKTTLTEQAKEQVQEKEQAKLQPGVAMSVFRSSVQAVRTASGECNTCCFCSAAEMVMAKLDMVAAAYPQKAHR